MTIRAHELVVEPDALLGAASDHPGLVDTWRQMHHLAQAVVEVGKSWGEPAADDSHSALTFDEDGDLESSGRGVVATLGLEVPLLGVDRDDDSEGAWLDADGITIKDATAWVRSQAERLAGPARQDAKPAPDLPHHDLASGAELDADVGNWLALAEHYTLTGRLLERLAEAVEPIAVESDDELIARCWPHHFDLASLVVLGRDGGGSGAMTKSIGVGLTPPDSLEGDGYWYVSPWMKDAPADAMPHPDLPIGRWVERGTLAMGVLPITDLWDLDDETAQVAALAEFVASAFNALLAQMSID